MAGQRTKIMLGQVAAEVSLEKISGERKGSQWETRVVHMTTGVEVTAVETDTPEVLLSGPPPVANVDALGAPTGAGGVPDLRGGLAILPQSAEQAEQRDSLASRSAGGAALPTRTERGVRLDDGSWVDLTAKLAEIDDAVKLEGLEVVASIAADTIPRDRVRGASFVAPVDEVGVKVCALLFDALSTSDSHGRRALAVRWTKRTNQALGIIVPDAKRAALVLLEVEWAANMRETPKRAQVGAAALALTDREREAAAAYVDGLAQPSSAIDELEDERRALHAQLLESAKAGEEFSLPGREALDEELAAILSGASA